MQENRVKRIMRDGGLALGTHVGGIADPQIVEITRDKKVVWTFKNFDLFGNDLVCFQILDAGDKVLR